jgi:hypothetical protein
MASRFVLTPQSAEFPSSNFPELRLVNRRPVLAFDAGTNETCQWTVRLPDDWSTSSSPTAEVAYIMASATSGDVDLDGSFEAVSDGDTVDLDTADSFDTVNSTDNTTVPGTAGYIDIITITLTNHDSSAPGDYARFKLTRDASSDTAPGDMYVLWVEIQDAA